MALLEFLRLALLVLHFLGLAALIGPVLVQWSTATRTGLRVMITGAVVQVVTGNGLIASNQLQGMHVVEAKMVAKLALVLGALALLITVVVRRRRGREGAPSPALHRGAGALGAAALLVAVVWT